MTPRPRRFAQLCVFLMAASSSSLAADGGVDGGAPTDAGGADAGATVGDAGVSPPDAGAPGEDAGTPPPPPPDPVWTCDPTYYDAADGCDCECGIPDPDCMLGNQALYGCPAEVASCSADGYCEIPGCGDGTVNPELEGCDDGNDDAFDGCSPGCRPEAGWSCSADPTLCVPVPTGWEGTAGPFCVDERYADGELCDCGCGVLDPDCADATAPCDGLPLGCIPTTAVNEDGEVEFELLSEVPSAEDNTQCVGNTCGDSWVVNGEQCDDGNLVDGDLCDSSCTIETPEGWTCNPIHVLDDVCDCGCGALDPACPGQALDPVADCAFDECRGPENVDPSDHGRCLEPDPVVDAGSEPAPDGGQPQPVDGGEPAVMPACSSAAPHASSTPLAGLLSFLLLTFIGRRRAGRAVFTSRRS